jgi:hypothetical protein
VPAVMLSSPLKSDSPFCCCKVPCTPRVTAMCEEVRLRQLPWRICSSGGGQAGSSGAKMAFKDIKAICEKKGVAVSDDDVQAFIDEVSALLPGCEAKST